MSGSSQPAVHHLVRYLRRLVDSGRRRVWLSPAAKEALVTLASAPRTPARSMRLRPAAALEPSQPPCFPDEGPTAPAGTPRARVEAKLERAPVAAVAQAIETRGDSPEEKIHCLAKLIQSSPDVRDLPGLRSTMVFSTGNPRAQLMLIGEAPGAEEERLGEPFVGRAGQLLTRILETMGLSRNQVYITNIVKYRPALPNQSTNNRPPTPEEMAACLPYLFAEIDAIQPRVIVALGATAARGLTGETDAIGRLRGCVRLWRNEIPLIITYHPSYLLRSESLSDKRKVWEDMLLAMEILNLPVTEKHRTYFRTAR